MILAGVTIQTLTGDNGLLQKATTAKLQSESAEAKEQIELEVLHSLDEYGNPNADTLRTGLSNMGATIKGTNLPILVTLDGHDFTVSEDCEVSKIDKDAINAVKIKIEASEMNDTEKLNYYQGIYGKTVDYKPAGNIQTSTLTANTPKTAQWKIFYADKSNIYLISDSFVTYDSLPKDFNDDGTVNRQFSKSDENNLYKANFTNIVGKYNNGIQNINQSSKANVLKSLNNDFFNWTNPETGKKEELGKNYSNMKAIAAMLDTDFWDTKYKDGNGYAEYTIGGPTIEMLFASYNQTHGTNYGAKAFKKGEKNANNENIAYEDGYKISKNADADRTATDWKYGDNMLDSSAETYNRLYRDYNHASTNGVTAYWLASPTAIRNYGLMWVRNNGTVEGYYYGNYSDKNNAFRPIICLNSRVQLVESNDQTYDYKLK